MTSAPTVHQFAVSCHHGDGITNGMLFTQRLLRSAGVSSEIYCIDIDPLLSSRIQAHSSYPTEGNPGRVLLIHHGIGCGVEEWLEQLPDTKILVFHNITPASHFSADHPIQPMLAQGWQQLERWRPWLAGAIADSQTNLELLLARDYDADRCRCIPLLVDVAALRDALPVPAARPLEDEFQLLFVGRLMPHKNQLALLEMLWHLRRLSAVNCSLVLVGGGEEDYREQLEARISALSLQHHVRLAGKISNDELAQAYAQADLYVSYSEHEGFGMPLVEAMVHRLPIVAYSSEGSNVERTIRDAGLVVSSNDAVVFAGVVAEVIEQPLLRRHLAQRGQALLEAFDPDRLLNDLTTFIGRLAPEWPGPFAQTDTASTTSTASSPVDLRVEGPSESSYSLAVVNRELALALAQNDIKVALHTTEGPGDYSVDANTLNSLAPSVRKLLDTGRLTQPVQSVLRLMYPLRMSGMNGIDHVASCYGWEESLLPQTVVRQINTHAHCVTSMSHYVSRVLRNNGVRIPVVTTGIGADHILRHQADESPLPPLREGFTLLHISSGFPRKGLDVLLAAYAAAFTADDDITLVIKTFPNPHNDIDTVLERWRSAHPRGARVQLINAEIPDGAIRALYQRSHVLVAPSRGEGFGLPMAEAMLHELPVLTTGYGGQRDFCNEDTAWLIDYRFERARSHLSEGLSVWAEPDRRHLANLLRELHEAYKKGDWQAATRDRTRAARSLIEERFTWSATAEQVTRALQSLDSFPVVRRRPRIGCVSTFNVKCGIASYSQLLLSPALDDCLIFANSNVEVLQPDSSRVTRCWEAGGRDDLSELGDAIIDAGVEQAIIQFNFSFFDLPSLRKLFAKLQASGIAVWLFCHSTADVQEPNRVKSLRQLLPEAERLAGIFVHSIADLNNLKAIGLTNNVCLFPHGVVARPQVKDPPAELREKLAGCQVIASYGFLLPHKGVQNLIRAFSRLLDETPDAQLLLVTALYPVDDSRAEAAACHALISELALDDHVTLITDFLEDAESLGLLRLADVLVFPYAYTQESSSAAVRWGLAADRPVYCTPLPIFDDVADAVTLLPGVEVDDLVQGLSKALDEPESVESSAARRRWLKAHDWDALSHRLASMLGAASQPENAIDDMASVPGSAAH